MSKNAQVAEADAVYEQTVGALLMPTDPVERERLVFSLGYLAGKDAVLTRICDKPSHLPNERRQ